MYSILFDPNACGVEVGQFVTAKAICGAEVVGLAGEVNLYASAAGALEFRGHGGSGNLL